MPTPGDESRTKFPQLVLHVIAPCELTVIKFTLLTPAPLPENVPENTFDALLKITGPLNAWFVPFSRAILAERFASATTPVMPPPFKAVRPAPPPINCSAVTVPDAVTLPCAVTTSWVRPTVNPPAGNERGPLFVSPVRLM